MRDHSKHIQVNKDTAVRMILEAFPVGGSHPKPTEAETAFGYYLMPSWEGEAPPRVGDMIKIELRPEFFGFYA